MYRGEPPAEYFKTGWARQSSLGTRLDKPEDSVDKPCAKLTLAVPMSIFIGDDVEHDHRPDHTCDFVGGGPLIFESDASIAPVMGGAPGMLELDVLSTSSSATVAPEPDEAVATKSLSEKLQEVCACACVCACMCVWVGACVRVEPLCVAVRWISFTKNMHQTTD